MKEIPLKIVLYLAAFLVCIPVISQDSGCDNLNFSHGNFDNWVGYTWHCITQVDRPVTIPKTGIVERRHTIFTDTTAFDPNTGGLLKVVPPGYKYSARLGDVTLESDTIVRNWSQSLRYTMQVDSGNALLILKFAIVARSFINHIFEGEHHFHYSILDENGNLKSNCSNFEICNSNLKLADFQWYYPTDWSSGYTNNWSDWTSIASDLTEYIGESITIEVFMEDCILPSTSYIGTWHTCFGYAYFVADCQPLEITQKKCDAESQPSLIAPDGFVTYQWTNDKGELLGNSRILEIVDPLEGAEYFCRMTSALDCVSEISTKVYMPELRADFNAEFNCDSNIVKFHNTSTTSSGSLFYLWNFEDDITSGDRDPKIIFDSSGIHQVTLNIINSISGCTNKIIKEVESFSLQTIGFFGEPTYCPGESTWIRGYGTSQYNWSNGLHTDSIEIHAPGGEYWLIASSLDNTCKTDTIYFSVIEEPDWNFWIEGDTILCPGEISVLNVNGAFKQIWNDGTELELISVSDSGIYYCIGENQRGCEKYTSIHISAVPNPLVEFTLSDTIVNSRNNIITVTAANQPNLTYLWDMGDGDDSLTGQTFSHSYDISYPGKSYTCKLMATNEYGCTNITSDEIVVIPFMPNIFTPNGDNINDVFMEGADLEIFDRYGKVMYRGTEGWDGYCKGQPADPDTYFYSVSYTYDNGKTQIVKGYITLIR